MALPETISQRNLNCVFNLLTANRKLTDDGSEEIKNHLESAIRCNLVDNDRFEALIGELVTLRVRFFDVGGGVEQITLTSSGVGKPLTRIDEERYSVIYHEGVASKFSASLRRKDVELQQIVNGVSHQNIKSLIAVLGGNTETELIADADLLPSIEDFMPKSIRLSERLFVKDDDNEWPVADWKSYLKDGLCLQDEFLNDLLPDMRKTWREALNAASKDPGRPIYAHLIPVVAWECVVCVVTIVAVAPIAKGMWSNLKQALETLGNVAGVLSAYAPTRSVKNRPDLMMPYFQTQSPQLWEDRVGDERQPDYLVRLVRNSGRERLANILKDVQNKLMFDVRAPVGESAIAQVILDKFVAPCLKEFFAIDTTSTTDYPGQELYKMLRLAAEGEEKLREIPQYRQHFIHSFHVCITGLRLLFEGNLGANGAKVTLADYLALKRNTSTDKLVKAWIVTALYHDVAYVVTSVQDWVGSYLERVLMAAGADSKTGFVANDIAKFVRHGEYPYALDALADCLGRYSPCAQGAIAKSQTLRLVLQGIMGTQSENSDVPPKLDHGIVSALMLLNSVPRPLINDEAFFLAADAIACHDAMWKNPVAKETGVIPPSDEKIPSYSRNYLRDLLVICDNIQQWGRSESETAQQLFKTGLESWSAPGSPGLQQWRASLEYQFIKGAEFAEGNTNPIWKKAGKFAKIWKTVGEDLGEVSSRFYLPCVQIEVIYRINQASRPAELKKLWDEKAREMKMPEFKETLFGTFKGAYKNL